MEALIHRDMDGLGTLLRCLLDELDGAVQQHYEARGEPFRPRFFPVARMLLAHEALTIRAISTSIGVSHSAVSQTVAEMQRLGLVQLARGRDGRERYVQLSAEGQACCTRLGPLWDGIARAASELDAELPISLATMLTATLARLEAEDFGSRIARNVQTSQP